MDDYSSDLSIDTPENLLLNAEIAGVGTRCLAALIDYFILILLLLLISYLFSRSFSGSSTNGASAVLVLIQFVLITGYHLIFELAWNGQTPGKRIFGLRVARANGRPLTATATLIRNLVRVFDFLPLFYGIGLVAMFLSRHTQRLGDLVAGTVVIRERRTLTLRTVKEGLRVQYQHIALNEPIPPYIHIERLNASDHQKVVNYLERRKILRDPSQVVLLVAAPIVRKMEDPAAEYEVFSGTLRAERFLEFVARAFEIGNQGVKGAPRTIL